MRWVYLYSNRLVINLARLSECTRHLFFAPALSVGRRVVGIQSMSPNLSVCLSPLEQVGVVFSPVNLQLMGFTFPIHGSQCPIREGGKVFLLLNTSIINTSLIR